ncbi:Y-family DNA polymerase [Rhodoplanes serenus]|uniref:Y-family DNA polymerase n=1 Tax=Rhodoplanes serenus TaxID=200615 RepID=UPI0012D76273
MRRGPASAVPAETPLAVVETERGALRLVAVDPAAAALGLAPGLTLADARARLPDLVARPAAPAADAAVLLRLAALCDRFTPLVAVDPPDGLVLDVTGCAHLFGGEDGLRDDARGLLARHGFMVRATLAGTPDTARALARFARVAIVPPGQDERHARALPVAALGAGPEVALALGRAGLRSLGDLADRSSTILAARFGEATTRRLARILGREDVRITPLRPPPDCWAERRCAEPLTHLDGALAALGELIDDIVARLEADGAGGRRFEASFFRTDGAVRRVAVETGRPLRDAGAIRRLFRERCDALADPLDPGFGFDLLRLAVPVAEPLDTPQLRLDGGAEQDDAAADLIDRLGARLGPDRVLRFAARDTHRPERAAVAVPAIGAAAAADAAAADAAIWAPEPGEPPRRPLQMFDPPQPIEVMAETPDGPPLRFRWRRVLHEVALAEGPERIAPEWWRRDADPAARDYYRIEDREGRRFWVFRRGLYGDAPEPPRWFLHGLFA